jgi:hypothetical protein
VQLLDRLVDTPATSRKVIFGESTDIRLARDLPKDITFEPPPCTWFDVGQVAVALGEIEAVADHERFGISKPT